MGVVRYLLLCSLFVSFPYILQACTMEDVDDWRITQDLTIVDIQRGTFWNKTTTDILSMTSISVGGGVNYENYLDVVWDAATGRFTISTSDGYEQYEENETSQTISFTVFFMCTGGANSLVFDIAVQDTNNNPPTFMPNDGQYEFTVTPPLPPGFQITGCGGDDIIVRDIDLTTSRIDFAIEDNPYFEIAYAGRSPSDPKEFLASLTTKDLIRSLSEDIELTIFATDVDGTQDPPITRNTTIRVKADEAFLFPEEPVFAQPFYIASYEDNQVVLDAAISLSQGFDNQVNFSLDGEYANNFRLVLNGNEVSIQVVNALSNEVLRSDRIVLVVKAEREYTSGATTTVIVQLPQALNLAFEQTQYQGRIVDNVLETLQVTLAQGYQDGFNVSLQNEYASYFSTSVQGNVITLQMTPLEASIIDGNNFLSLLVTASNDYSSATAVVTLDIIKDDNVSPVFENAIFTGEYTQETGLALEQIVLGQGYDQTVSFSLSGEHAEFFSISNTGAVITLSTSGIPAEIWPEQQLLLTIAASKPRAVTASTAVAISLPAARELSFALPTYSGTLQDTTLTLEEITLSVGYDEDVNFTLSGVYATYFTLSPAQNGIEVTLSAAGLPDEVIAENNFLTLTVSAFGMHAVTTSTTILLEIIKQDTTTPVFSEKIYSGVYVGNSIEIGNISLSQGYDSSVTFRLEGEHAQYFQVSDVSNNLNLALVSDVPPDVIFAEQVLLFSVLAEKPLTVGAHATVSITFSRDLTETTLMRFSKNTYIGSLENNNLVLDTIVLETGYETGTEFSLSGEYQSYFSMEYSENVVNVTIQNGLPEEIIDNNEFIILQVEATRERAVSIPSSIVIGITREEVTRPEFSNAYYKTVFADGNLENLIITLSEGYDETVTFELQGDNSIWFSITNVGNNVQLALNTAMESIPEQILENNDYFLFSIIANKPDSISARAAIFIHLPKETPEPVLVRFSQVSYVGRIENGVLYAPQIILTGEREPISFNVTGEYVDFFEVTQITPTNVEIRLKDGSLPANINEIPFIILDIEAQYPEAVSGYTTVILEIVGNPDVVTPVFEQAYYTGVFSVEERLTFDQTIRLSQGFDETVVFTLAGDDAQWFELSNTSQNSFTLILSNNELGQLTDRSHLVFSVVASKNNNVTGNAAIIISLSDYTTISTSLRFAQNTYIGSIQNNILTLDSIIIEEGYSSNLNISFTGDHIEYFELTAVEDGFTLQLLSELPDSIIEENKVLVFTIEANNGNSRTHTTIVLEIIKADLGQLTFEEAYYVGSYSSISGFTFDPQITLSNGFDGNVLFALEGESSQYFEVVQLSENSVSLDLITPIPSAVVMNNHHLIFSIVAEKPGNLTARATVVIVLLDEYIEDKEILGFDRITYLGTLENGTLNLEEITLVNSSSNAVEYGLFGDLESYFALETNGSRLSIVLSDSIPEQSLPENGVIVLELQASATGAISAHAAIVITVVQKRTNSNVEQLIFSEVYYTGQYTEIEGLTFTDEITLSEGFDTNVTFVLEGDDSQYFEFVAVTSNLLSLRVISPIPSSVVMNNHQLIFTIRAEKPDAITARAAVVISLLDESIENMEILGFDRITYIGSLENGTLSLGEITLINGSSNAVEYGLFGDFESYFTLEIDGSIVSITLTTPIPEQSLPDNGVIVLELQASATGALSAHAAIVITVVTEETSTNLEQLIFSEVYYSGHYTEAEGLTFTDEITLSEGFGANVSFVPEGDNSQYFELVVVNSNSLSLRIISPIPSSVVMNNHQLIFTIRAEKPDAIVARAAVIISLLDEFIENIEILGFDRITYLGSLENGTLSLGEISLINGSSNTVEYGLFGDFESYFTLETDESRVSITLTNPIPEQSLPDNGVIVLELQASATGAMSAHAAIVITVVTEEINTTLEQLLFSEVYYSGYYSEAEGLTFTDEITLSEGFDTNVSFLLEGDNSQYFELVVVNSNSLSLRIISPIPSSVVMNNHQLIFTIRAEKPDAIVARAAVIISLLDEFIENIEILGFDRITYLGSLENGTLSLGEISLINGSSNTVEYGLFGDFESYFTLETDESRVSITLTNPIPEQSLPDHGVIVLELQASATGAMSAHAAIVITVVTEEINTTLEQLLFSEVYYSGYYSEAEGLAFTDEITLSEGFDTNVSFLLEGDNSQYFELVVVNSNSLSLRIISPIPSSVVMNNHQLIFTIRAEKPDAIVARAAVIISLLDEFIENIEILGFDRITYLGSLGNGTLSLGEISLINGSSNTVEYGLFGDFESYFTLETDESRVSITLTNPIPEQSLPDNGVIVLELQASATGAMSAHAAIVITVVTEEINTTLEQLLFSEVYYSGYYSEAEGLTFTDEITLSEGFDTNVSFLLEGDNSQYFELVVVNSNSLSLRIISPIPSSVVMNNHQLIFTIRAEKPDAIVARAAVIISLLDEFIENIEILGFDRITYLGSLENGTLSLGEISLINGSSNTVEYGLFGDFESYFTLETDESRVSITLTNPIPEQSLPDHGVIVLELQASATGAMSAHAAIVITVVTEEINTTLEQLLFSEVYYSGYYSEAEGLAFTDEITLSEGFDTNVSFLLEGDNSQYFELVVVNSNSLSLRIISPIPSSVVMNNHQLIFTIRAEKPDAIVARAAVIISLLDEFIENIEILGFDRITYLGSLENGTLSLGEISLINGSSNTVEYGLFGDFESYFTLETDESRVLITLTNPIPEQSLPDNGIIVLELQASATGAMSAHAAIVITVVTEETNTNVEQLVFSEVYYTGHYTEVEGLTFTDEITLSEGFDTNVTFTLEGDSSQYFEAVVTSNLVSLRMISPIPSSVVMNNHQLIFSIRAEKPDAIGDRATIVISLLDEINETTPVIGFNRISYFGSIEENTLNIDPIVVSEGYSSEVIITLRGELQNYFTISINEGNIIMDLTSPIPEEMLTLNRIIVLEIQATAPDAISAHATIIIEVVQDDVEAMMFSEPFYTGQYNRTDDLTIDNIIELSQGYDDSVVFSLDGDDAQWFQQTNSGNIVSIFLSESLPEDVLESRRKLIFVIVAQNSGISTRATIIISLVNDAVGSGASFGRILYEGIVQNSEVRHEEITLSGYDGTDVQLLGEYAALFSATHSEGAVVIEGRGSVTLSPDVSYVALQLQAGEASAVLLLDVEHSENPELPSVSFSSSSYVLTTDVTHTGIIGQVLALADNNEAVTYSPDIENEHLLQRLSVSNDGELILWAPVNSGIYNFDVIATTVFTKVSASVPVQLTVEVVTIIDENNYVLPPLQILDRDEESAYQNLIPFNASAFEGCRFSLSNRWPVDQDWLYVDENGLHTTAIDREDESIASMALSQIQVELVLQCDSDDVTRSERSVFSEAPRQLEQLGSYDYGNNKWVLTDSINYNPRRSLVNLIVNDINDNAPVFEGKENEPIVVGYPVADLEERILPRALIQVKATDADVGENAAIVYSSEAENLAVSPTTGFVHVRDIAGLENNVTFTVQATDRNGQGLTGTLDILVKLIDTSHIAVVTIQDAFLHDEQNILSNLSASVGYEVKTLRSTVISDTESNEPNSRKKRETTSSGASLQLYVYGLIEQEPVNVERLTGDINTSVIETLIVASTVSLENHLEICPLPGRDTALLVSTIVLAVLLFILIVAAAVWFFLKWRKENYEQFADQSSLGSQDVSVVSPAPVMKPEQHPRMNIEDLKRSEKRLQEMLETTPATAPLPPPLTPSTLEKTKESKVNIPEPPLVFQSFDKLKNADESDEDEFGEVKKNRRKSVVTFNENVEKIFHVEDNPNDDPEIEVYRL